MIAPPRAMIYYLCKRHHQYTIRWRLQQDFDVDVVTRRELLRRLCLLSYETAFRLRSLPAGTYIFADLERLAPVQRWLRRTKRWLVRNRERSALDQT